MPDVGCTCSKHDHETLTVPEMIEMLERIHDEARCDIALVSVAELIEKAIIRIHWLRGLAGEVASERNGFPLIDAVQAPHVRGKGAPAPTSRTPRTRQ